MMFHIAYYMYLIEYLPKLAEIKVIHVPTPVIKHLQNGGINGNGKRQGGRMDMHRKLLITLSTACLLWQCRNEWSIVSCSFSFFAFIIPVFQFFLYHWSLHPHSLCKHFYYLFTLSFVKATPFQYLLYHTDSFEHFFPISHMHQWCL